MQGMQFWQSAFLFLPHNKSLSRTVDAQDDSYIALTPNMLNKFSMEIKGFFFSKNVSYTQNCQ